MILREVKSFETAALWLAATKVDCCALLAATGFRHCEEQSDVAILAGSDCRALARSDGDLSGSRMILREVKSSLKK